MPISRRTALTAGLSAAVLAAARPAAVAAARTAGQHTTTAARDRALRFLDLMLDAHYPAGVRLPQSHSDEVGLYTTGFTYDSALAILAYLARNTAGATARARVIGDALRYAEAHDPGYHDGRLRDAYFTGPFTRGGVAQPYGLIRPDGTANIGGPFGFTGTNTGALAWAGVALCALHTRTGVRGYLDTAVRFGGWIVGACRSRGALGGFTVGAGRTGLVGRPVSTSYNAVIVAFLGQLYKATGERGWMENQHVAVALVDRMWSAEHGHYLRGSANGAIPVDDVLSTEAQTLPALAMRSRRTATALATVRRELTVTDTAARRNSAVPVGASFTGLTFSATSRTVDVDQPIEGDLPKPDRDAVWLEGTAQFAAALRHSPTPSAVAVPLAQVMHAQAALGRRQHVGDRPIPAGLGVVAATSPLHVGVEASGYYPCLHVAASAWFVLAASGVNPLYSDYS